VQDTAEIHRIVDRYVAAFNDNDASGVPLAPDAVLGGPMSPQPKRGEAAVRQYIQEVAPFIARMTLKRLVAEPGAAAAVIEFEGLNGSVVEGAEFFRFQDGCIVEARAYYDTRPLMQGSGPAG
jgi:hypothetical protein